MRVLQINTVVSYGSTGRICRDIADVLKENGHDCVIAYGRGEDSPNYDTIKIGGQLDNLLHYGKSYLLDRHGFGSKAATKEFLKKINDYKPDIIHLHNIHGYYLNIEMLFEYLKESQIPVVWLLHDAWPVSSGPASFKVDYENNLLSYEKKNYSNKEYPATWKRIGFCKNLKDKKRIFTSLDNMTIITPSKWLKSVIEKSFLNKYPIKVIYNGIDTSMFKPIDSSLRKNYNLENKKILLAVASVWTESKGLNFLLDIPKKLPKDYQLVMIGVDRKIKKNISSSIIAIDKTNSIEELVKWYSTADIFINPTLFDNFPTVNIEALSCGTPIITYDTGGSGESVTDSTGIVVPQNNQKIFIKSIKKFPKKNKEIIDRSLKRSRKFSKSYQFKKYINLYNDIAQ